MRVSPSIQDLRVAHWPKSPEHHPWPAPEASSEFVVDTCLRQIQIGLPPAGTHGPWRPFLPRKNPTADPELRSGGDAYQFLLEVTTGMRSAIPGETNVFGQFKKDWIDFRRTGEANAVTSLAPFMHRLINDTKAVRQQYLEGIGGSSYGSLVRKLIAPNPDERILFIGAGDLTQSMLPFFSSHRLGIWNHRNIPEPNDRIDTIFLPDQGNRAANWANHVILTTPPDALNDKNWLVWLAATQLRTVVHLGNRNFANRLQRRSCSRPRAYYNLDDVFALRRAQDSLRSDQLMLAKTACRQRTQAFAAADRFALTSNMAAPAPQMQDNIRHPGFALA
jgi:hypothetical protein